MSEHEAVRTLVKSPPELWEVCSDPESLARHLQGFGEIRITRVEPESTVAWEGERVSGTVRIEPSGWGTKVTLTATAEEETPAPVPPDPPQALPVQAPPALTAAGSGHAVQPGPDPVAAPSVPPSLPPRRRRGGLLARLLGRLEPSAVVAPVEAPVIDEPPPIAEDPPPVPQAPPEPRLELPPEPAGANTSAALDAALDSLGQAHHRPFSRS
jgi:hypothetical protein